MKKFNVMLTLFLAATLFQVQAQDSKYMHSDIYTFAFADDVTIKIGGATQTKTTGEWAKDGKVGQHTVDAKTMQALKDATSGKFKIEIEKKSIGTLHGMQVTDMEKGTVIRGIYNSKDHVFTFGSAKSTKSGGTTRTDMGVIKGTFNDDFSKINDGDFGLLFVVGNANAMVSANAIFHFTGSQFEQ